MTHPYASAIAEAVRNHKSIDAFLLPTDCQGDGYDIAVAPHRDEHDIITADLKTLGIEAVTINRIYANGAMCGYHIIAQAPGSGLVRVAMQHSGNWGPWFHVSVYRRQPSTKSGWVYDHHEGGHFNRRHIPNGVALSLPRKGTPEYDRA